jgi:hypothetical protein
MRDTFFLNSTGSCFLVILLVIMPVSASPNGSQAHAADSSIVTIYAPPPARGAYIYGDRIPFSGINSDSNTTYLFVTGPDLWAAGSQIESNDSRIAPVTNGVVSTFRAVSVGTGNQWSWTWDTHKVPLNTGTYTVYAVSTPRDKNHLGSAVYDSITVNITESTLSAAARPTNAREGEIITISGKATGKTASGIAIWVIGPDYADRSVVEPDLDGSFSWEIDSGTTHLLPGVYHVFVEHPSSDETFDLDLNGDYLFNNRIRSNIFTFRGNGRLYGEAAYTAFSAAVNGPRNDDLIVPVTFSLGVPSATAVTVSPAPSVSTTDSAGIRITESGNTTVTDSTAGQKAAETSLTQSPVKTIPEVTGTPSGNFSSPSGNADDGLPYGILVVIAGIILIACAGGAIVVIGKMRPGTVPEKSPGNIPVVMQRGMTRDPGTRPETTLAGNTFQKTLPAATPASPAIPMNAFPRELADKYTQISPIGSGGFAMVYSAYRISDNQKVAVKIPIRSNERTGKSFLHEIRVWETMHHPNIVEVRTANILPVPYVEMEYVPGSLESMAKPVDIVSAARIIRGIVEGIRYAHARRCIHRDIKPQNILLTDQMVPKITDWGISKVLEENSKKTTVAGFSLSYAAPEQIEPDRFGSTDERTDIYQIGAVFYELVTGSTAFYGDSMMELVNATLEEDPIFPSDYNPDAAPVDQIILKCLAKYPALRYQSAGELLDALEKFLSIHDRQAS